MFCQGFTLVIYPIEIDGTAEVPNGTNHLKYLLTHDIPFQKTEDKSGSLPQKYAQALR